MKNNNSIDIPLLFFFFAFCVVLFGLFSKLLFQTSISIPSSSISQQQNTKPLKKLNYNLPIMCNYQTKDSSISASIDTSSIMATILSNRNIQRYVVQGDCLYSWNTNIPQGTKKCGVGNYITIGKQLLGSGLASADSLSTIAKQMGKSLPVDIGMFLESCSNVKEIKKEGFVVPKNIEFK